MLWRSKLCHIFKCHFFVEYFFFNTLKNDWCERALAEKNRSYAKNMQIRALLS